MKAAALSSGSEGNCFYIEDNDTAVLIDVGISTKKVNERLSILNLQADKIKAIFLTHEHIDHIRGVDVLARQLHIPIYATKGTIESGYICSNKKLIKSIKRNDKIKINNLLIESFEKSHKAAEPVSFSISSLTHRKNVAVITDVGYACPSVNEKVAKADFLFLESNHDIKMLENGPYPYFLQKWVRGDDGHLSNTQAALSVLEFASPQLKNIVLSHISSKNNTPQLALKTFNKILKERSDLKPDISLSLFSEPTKLFSII